MGGSGETDNIQVQVTLEQRGGSTLSAVENSRATLQSTLHTCGSASANSTSDCVALSYVFSEKKCEYKWTCMAQSHAVQGSSVNTEQDTFKKH